MVAFKGLNWLCPAHLVVELWIFQIVYYEWNYIVWTFHKFQCVNIFRRFNISWICQVSTQVTSWGGEGGAITLSKMASMVFSVAGTTIYSSDTCFECTQFGLSRKSGVKEQTNLYLQFWKDSVHRLSKYLFLSRSIFDKCRELKTGI